MPKPTHRGAHVGRKGGLTPDPMPPRPSPPHVAASCPRAQLYQCDLAGRTAWRGEQALQIILTNPAGWHPPHHQGDCPGVAAIAPGLLCIDLTRAPLSALTSWQGLGQTMLPQPILALAAGEGGTKNTKQARMASLTLPAHSQQVLHRLEGVLDLSPAQVDDSARQGQHAFKAWATCPRPCLQVRGL